MQSEQEIRLLISRLKREHRAAKKLHKTVDGIVECPVCGASLRFMVNGWTWKSSGWCASPGCLEWRE